MRPYYSDEWVTLYHGDCHEVLPLVGGVDHVITDPPYGIDYQSCWRSHPASRFAVLKGDERPALDWLPLVFPLVSIGCLACFCRWDTAEEFRLAIGAAGFTVTSQGVWDRVGHGMGDLAGALAPCHDLFWFATKGDFAFHGARPLSVYRSQRPAGEALSHPTQKPENLLMAMVTDYARPGALVLDPFAGSGTTLVAAKRVGRRAVGIEVEERYCEVAAQRLSQGTLAALFG